MCSIIWPMNSARFAREVTAFLGTLFLGVLMGILVSVGLSLVIVIYESARPQITILWRIPGTSIYRNMKQESSGTFVQRLDRFRRGRKWLRNGEDVVRRGRNSRNPLGAEEYLHRQDWLLALLRQRILRASTQQLRARERRDQVKEMLLAHVNDLEEVNETQYIAPSLPLRDSVCFIGLTV